jgi:ATP-binding cassette subfamily B protein
MGRKKRKPRPLGREVGRVLKRARKVWRLVPRRHKLSLGGAALVMAITSAANTALPLLLGRLVDAVGGELHGTLPHQALYRTALFYLRRRCLVENACTRIDRDMTVRVVSHLLKVDLSTFTRDKVGALNGRIARSVTGFVRFLRLGFLDFFPALLTGAFALCATLSKQPWLGLIMIGVIPASLLLTIWQLLSQKSVRLKLIRSREQMDGTVVEQLSGLDYVRVANTHREEVKRVALVAEKRRVREQRHHFEMALFGSGKALNEGLFHILVVGLAIYFAVQGSIKLGDILTFSMLFLNVMVPLSEVHRVIDETHESSLQVGDLLDMLAEPVDRSFTSVVTREPHLLDGEPIIAIEDLHVDYRDRKGVARPALRGVSMTIDHGETIGIAGRSGSGKSTWLRVLMRLVHPHRGRVSLGGVPLEEISRASIGDLVGYVGQGPFVFAGTVAENIGYGCEQATRSDIERAAQLAHIHDEILAMPSGYEAPIAERGSNLSGGQKQRIALARVFLKNPPILILDEGTSALDNISERKVQRALMEARQDRTVILVAHRLSTLRDADRIFVFSEGCVVETGGYEELLNRDGALAELAASAVEGYRSPDTSRNLCRSHG